MPGIGSDPCPPGAAAGLRSVLPAMEESLHSEQAWPQGPEETGSGTDTVALGTRVWAVSLLPWGRRTLITPLCVCVSSPWGEGLHSVPGPRSSLEPGDIGHCPPPFLGGSTCLLVTCRTLGFYAWGTQFCEGQDVWLQSGSWVAGAPQAAERWSASRDLCWEWAVGFVSPRFTHTDELLDRP